MSNPVQHTARILDGKATAQTLLERVATQLGALPDTLRKPKLVVVLVGNNAASEVYVANKVKKAQAIGMDSDLQRFPQETPEAELVAKLEALNADPGVDAILVQLPLPKQIDTMRILKTVAPDKDVDGFHPENLGKLVSGIEPTAMPCTPAGIIELLDAYDIPVAGKHAVVVGRSNIVGKPISLMLLHRNATVTMCHSRTADLLTHLQSADIIIAAAGQPGLIPAEAIKPGAVVIDVGINRLETGKLVGDVDFDSARARAGNITPVPGGVGPMTIAMLMQNTVRLHAARHGLPVAPLLMK